MFHHQTPLWLILQERERESLQHLRRRQARAYAQAVRARRGPRFRPLRRRVGGWFVRVGMWLIAPACATDSPLAG